jgi:small-conductance mechanosensitive channel
LASRRPERRAPGAGELDISGWTWIIEIISVGGTAGMFEGMTEYSVFGNTVRDYLVSLVTAIVGVFLIRVVLKSIVLRRIKKWAERTRTTFDDVVVHLFTKTILPILYVGAFYLAIKNLALRPIVGKVIDVFGVVLLTVFGIRFVTALTIYAIESYWIKKEEDEGRKQNLRRLFPLIKVVLWGIGVIFLLDNLGFKISTVIAGLGIGGIAVALAAQAVLGDLFSYFSILFDKPFEIGDFIIVGDYLGTVEHVGIKTTRLRSLSGEQLIFSNTDLTNSRVRNYKRMERRRVLFRLGVTYQTGLAHLKEIPLIIEGIIKNTENAAFDRAHFFSYGDFSLVFEVVYYVIGADYNLYMGIQQGINFALKEEFDRRGIEFAYPTQTLYLNIPKEEKP